MFVYELLLMVKRLVLVRLSVSAGYLARCARCILARCFASRLPTSLVLGEGSITMGSRGCEHRIFADGIRSIFGNTKAKKRYISIVELGRLMKFIKV